MLVLILFDFSAASETTDHSPLLHLAPRTPCSWFSSHLSCCFFLLPGILTLEGPRAQYLACFSSTAQLYQSALTNAYQYTKHFRGFKYCLYANYSPSYIPFQTFLPNSRHVDLGRRLNVAGLRPKACLQRWAFGWHPETWISGFSPFSELTGVAHWV